jgi:transketolase
MYSIKELEIKALEVRKRIIRLIYEAKTGHTGGSLSSVDILVVLYFGILNLKANDPDWAERDRFILSKGHSAEALYCVLREAGFFSEKILSSYGTFNSMLSGHPTVRVPGIELNSGALGHGLSVGVGMALTALRDHKSYKVYVLMGDGEQGEGSVMEAANAGSHYKLDNLIAIIDRNRLQISGNTEEVMSLNCLETRWNAYGWAVRQVNGNRIEELLNSLKNVPFEKGKPNMIIANTTKGKGVSFIEDMAAWHHKVPDEEQYIQSIQELDKQLEELN